jgi:3-methyladenine DNA glycosylase AlkD
MNTAEDVAEAIRRDLARAPGTTTAVRGVRRKWTRELAEHSPAVVMRVVSRLAADGAWPQRVVAFELLESHARAFAKLTAARVIALARGLADWGSIDLFGVTVAGPAWRDRLIPDAAVLAWTKSPDRWRRRLALVATVRLNTPSRGGKGDAARTLAVCRTLVSDRDDMVVKAMSWALRELAKRDPAAVRRFLAAEGARLAPRVRREVTNKLETGLKNP